MAMRESDIMHENGDYWVGRTPKGYAVLYNVGAHSVSDTIFSKTRDGLSLAIAYCNYRAKRAIRRRG